MLLSISILFLSFVSAFGQSYNPLIRPDFQWEVLHGYGASICQLNGGGRYFFQGDTVISGNEYSIIRTNPIVPLIEGPFCPPFAVDTGETWMDLVFLREDTAGRKVFVYNQDLESDELFYDFTLAAGDTLNSYYAGQGIDLIVDSTATIFLLNGEPRKIFYLNNGENYIESIGGSQGVQFPIIVGIGFWEIPQCYRENDLQIWGEECYAVVGVDDRETTGNMARIFPNPSGNFIKIELNLPGKFIFTLYDVTGKKRAIKSLVSNPEILDVSEFSSGTYFYQIHNSKEMLTGKLMIVKN